MQWGMPDREFAMLRELLEANRAFTIFFRKLQAAEGLTNMGLFAMSGSFGLVALLLGFVMGRREADHRASLSSSDPSSQSLLH